MLNAGDHEHMRLAFTEAIKIIGVSYDVVDSIEGVHKYCENARAGKPAKSSITLFAFKVCATCDAPVALLFRCVALPLH